MTEARTSGGGAVIVPAHDEEAVITRTLAALAPLTALGVEVWAVANGCSDATAARARELGHVHVLEIAESSKTAALNAGDAATSRWPRLYLDADIAVTPTAVQEVFAALTVPGVLAARPTSVYDVEGCGAVVRSYYRARNRIPGLHAHVWGAGAYALAEAGHERLGRFPPLVADDLFVDQLFAAGEIRVVPTAPVVVRCPRNVSALLRTLRRVYAGRRAVESRVGVPAVSGPAAVLATVKGPRSLADAVVYTAVVVVAKLLARRPSASWLRDETSRSAEVPVGVDGP